eukprot:MONOS_6800.1-p1 / transcript=MONOS_6800.1 / gene=MONOS_6800 / organism=Monocercomonoides_exilis_PA203 / gene_product=unspecified product / transcript_product=unspecified product / location=Mono_scaffold00221:55407-56134(-) / protein_length=219 / sequence_SO=supercontig / SO=protein_coding / is_pseudo=false
MALCNVGILVEVEKDFHQKEITEIIEYHQEHRNLTHLAYQLAWSFLIDRFFRDESLEALISDKLHFTREATQELEEMSKRVDWKAKGKTEENKRMKEVNIMLKWICTINVFFVSFQMWKEEYFGLIDYFISLCRSSRAYEQRISGKCMVLFRRAIELNDVSVYDLLKRGVFKQISEEIYLKTMNDTTARMCLESFFDLSKRLKGIMTNEVDEMKKKRD